MSEPIRINRKPSKVVTIHLWPEIIKRVTVANVRGAVQKGLTSNLSYLAYWAFLFDLNEHLPTDRKMTDYSIARNVLREFPNWKPARQLVEQHKKKKGAQNYYTVPWFRRRYNMGQLFLVHGKYSPRTGPVSFRYNNDGQACANHSPTRLLSPEEIADRKLKLAPYGSNYEAHEIDPPVKPYRPEPKSRRKRKT
jgi:hypothetical protein